MTLEEATVLIVDDEPMLQEICTLWLQLGGCEKVFTASDGFEALALLEELKVDVLITDIHMPKMDGSVLIKKIRERGFSIPSILFMSACMDVDAAEMVSLGVKEFLEKPFTMDILLQAVAASFPDSSYDSDAR